MCGIAGHVRWNGIASATEVSRMVGCLAHRGPDDSGVWMSADNQCVLGHARLSILDLTEAGHQPMTDPSTGNVIVFNGEIYNHRQRRAECERDGYVFRSHSDTEVILALYRKYGHDCVHKLRGMFAFAIWDAKRRELFISRDRVGKKPLHYALSPDGLVFASELDALTRHVDISRDIDPTALEMYFQLQYIPAPLSIFRSIRKLPPASYAVLCAGGFRVQQYWDVDYRAKVELSETEALDGLEEILRESIELRMIADVPIGALLSGGVDSSLVVAMMAQLTNRPVQTFSIGFAEQKFSELPFAQQVADRYRTDHHPKILQGEVAPLLATIVRHYGEPYADSSAVPSFHVACAARRHVKVVMNGDGGDELLGGYPRYWLSDNSIRAGRVFGRLGSPASLVRAAGQLVDATSFTERARRKWLLRAYHPELQSVMMYSDFWGDKRRSYLLECESDTLPDWRAHWLTEAMQHGNDPVDRMLWIDNRTYLPGDLLVKMDIATMHCGLESRSPLLDHELIEYCAALPTRLKVHDRTGKYLLKRLAERYLPHDLIYRKKMGFGIPLAEWLRGPLAPLVHEILGEDALPPLNPRVVRTTLKEFYGGADHASRVWSLLMFGLWARQYGSASC